MEYVVKSINGDYAVLSGSDGKEVFISLFLLPQDLCEGDRLRCENLMYEKI